MGTSSVAETVRGLPAEAEVLISVKGASRPYNMPSPSRCKTPSRSNAPFRRPFTSCLASGYFLKKASINSLVVP